MSPDLPNVPWEAKSALVENHCSRGDARCSHWGFGAGSLPRSGSSNRSCPGCSLIFFTLPFHPCHKWSLRSSWKGFLNGFSPTDQLFCTLFKWKGTGLPERFPVFETPCGCMFTGKVGLTGDDYAWFKNLVLPGVLVSMSELFDIWQQENWVQHTSPLTNLLESITWVTVPDIYFHSILLKNVLYLFILQLLLLFPYPSELNVCAQAPGAFSLMLCPDCFLLLFTLFPPPGPLPLSDSAPR